jgi:hypothetical protein
MADLDLLAGEAEKSVSLFLPSINRFKVQETTLNFELKNIFFYDASHGCI